MKSLTRHFLIWSCVLCLLLTGCQSARTAPSGTTAPVGSESATTPEAPDSGAQITPGTIPSKTPDDATEIRPIETAGKARLPYTGNQASVRYITSPDQLPEQAGLEGYDEAYFEERALLLIIETVGSGSVQVEAESISFLDGVASVCLSHELPGDAGTADMATWLLWVELEAGLDYTWELDNPTFPSDTATQ